MPGISIYVPCLRPPRETPEARNQATKEIRGRKEVSLERVLECLCVSVRRDKHSHLRDGRGFPQSRAHHACLFYFPSESRGCPTRLCV